MKRTIILILACISTATLALDLGGQNSGYMGEYLYSFGSSAKSLALGGAGVASIRDSSLSYFNPAGISETVNKEATIFYAPLYANTSFSYIGVTYPLEEGSVFSIARCGLDVSGIDKTDSTGNLNGSTGVYESAYLLSYGKQVGSVLSVGVNLKVVSSSIDTYSAVGYGVDLGAIFKLSGFNIGVTLQNVIQPAFTFKTEAEPFPLNLRGGVAAELIAEKLFVYSDLCLMNLLPKAGTYSAGYKATLRWFEGIEYKVAENISVRGGINYKEITVGAGYSTGDFDIDYAAGFHSLGLSHRVSLCARFGLMLSEQEKWIVEKEKEVNFKLYYGKAYKYFNEGKFAEAKDELVQATAILPDSAEAFDLLAQIEAGEKSRQSRNLIEQAFIDMDNGKAEDAKSKIEEAKKLDGQIIEKIVEEFTKKSDELNKDKKYEESMKLVGRILAIDPENTFAQELYQQLQSIMEFVK